MPELELNWESEHVGVVAAREIAVTINREIAVTINSKHSQITMNQASLDKDLILPLTLSMDGSIDGLRFNQGEQIGV